MTQSDAALVEPCTNDRFRIKGQVLFKCTANKWVEQSTALNFNRVIGKPSGNVAVAANTWTDVFALGLMPSEIGGNWDIDAKMQIESGAVNILQYCSFQLVVRTAQGVLLETLDEAASSKGAILSLKNFTPVSMFGRYQHNLNAPLSAVMRVSCTTAQTVTASGTAIRANYRKL